MDNFLKLQEARIKQATRDLISLYQEFVADADRTLSYAAYAHLHDQARRTKVWYGEEIKRLKEKYSL